MPLEAALAALCSAILHASWNALVKRGGDPVCDFAMVMFAGALALSPGLFVFPLPRSEAWPYLLASPFLHLPYGLFLSTAYRAGGLAHVFTIARGTPPLLVALVMLALGEILLPGQYAGIALISLGILSTGFAPGESLKATVYALLTAAMIASYTALDGIGARVSGEPFGFIVWHSLLNALVWGAAIAVLRGGGFLTYARANWRRAAVGGPAGALGYGLVLWAMTIAPVAAVSALRETSVIVAALIGWVFFGEAFSKRRAAGVALVVAGATLLKLA
jgi:drug/metabolite transporter (DMT)-like permease